MLPRDPEWERMPDRVRRKYIEILRSIPPGRRMEIAGELSDAVRELMAAGIRAVKPDASDEEIRREIIRHTLPPDLVDKVYHW